MLTMRMLRTPKQAIIAANLKKTGTVAMIAAGGSTMEHVSCILDSALDAPRRMT